MCISGGRERVRLQSIDEEVSGQEGSTRKRRRLQGADTVGRRLQGADTVGSWLQGADTVGSRLQGADTVGSWLQGASAGTSQPKKSAKRSRSASTSEVESSGQMFLTASPKKRLKKRMSLESIQPPSEKSPSHKQQFVIVIVPEEQEESGLKGRSPTGECRSPTGKTRSPTKNNIVPPEKSRSPTEIKSRTHTEHHDKLNDPVKMSSSSKVKQRSSKDNSRTKSVEFDAQGSTERPALKLTIRSKSTSNGSAVNDPYDFGASQTGDTTDSFTRTFEIKKCSEIRSAEVKSRTNIFESLSVKTESLDGDESGGSAKNMQEMEQKTEPEVKQEAQAKPTFKVPR